MSDGLPVRFTAQTAAQVCERFQLSDSARLLMRDDQTPRQLLDLLVEGRHHLDAERLLAHSLPKREAVWWAIQCARIAHGESAPASVQTALRVAEAWIANPTDENRRAAMPAAEGAGIGTPAGCATVAAYFSGGSLAPVGLQEVPPGEHVTAQCVTGSVLMAAVMTEPEKANEKHRRYLGIGLRIADGGDPPPGASSVVSVASSTVVPAQPAKPRESLFF